MNTEAPETTPEELDAVLRRAADAAPLYAALPAAERARALRAVADALDGAVDELVPVAMAEAHYPEARCRSELGRTTFQLRLFADVLEEGEYLEAMIDPADPDWGTPRPDVRRLLVPLGPVVVFGASNFPFAFSTAGGDSASALAAGCPVVVKAHPGHPELARRTADLVIAALADSEAPEGVFALVSGFEAGRRAVTHPLTRAVGFTGSIPGGRALYDLAVSRPEPIPFYGELGSVNPVFVTRAAMGARGEGILEGYAGSATMGSGQFCTKPGVVFVPEGAKLDALVDDLAARAAAPLLNDRVAEGFARGLDALAAHPATEVLVSGEETGQGRSPSLLRTDLDSLLEHSEDLLAECFGPATLVVTYPDERRLLEVGGVLRGQLTVTVHGEEDDPVAPALLALGASVAGRVVWNGWPTGVAVTHAMTHGGPYPATTAPSHTSVGSTAIRRFLRPVTYQSVPQPLLPPELRDGNPLAVPRRVNGGLPSE
ncbi:aldehyde dehydrogenase [Nocardiopsis terrae]|uniref:NADP-dependent aldehyde dehydrogenase n=1 Tax=Nocardiopsis terrae TaxID=372655 RepID=A0ABR9H9R3_9ACTN|nr:aldehyde dehydrogenase (NADP(+)) [Nocardiopsis terrae]MBE1455796.1 NADP-dependent aldehyde dehydrogenase [Nocardiopsis terrae]GHC92576.1 aldehyde dehydrogenase [Nocardiopsis terrae]